MVEDQRSSALRVDIWVATCYLVAVLVQVYPLPPGLSVWRPQVVLMVAIYWAYRNPFHRGIEMACLAGLLLDVVYGGVLGQHGLAFGLAIYVLKISRQQLQHFTIWHQALIVLLLVLVSQVMLQSINLLVREQWPAEVVIYPAISSALIWPGFVLLVNRLIRPR